MKTIKIILLVLVLRGNVDDITLAVWTVEHIDVNIFTGRHGRHCNMGKRRRLGRQIKSTYI
jgi:hypothetical protein